MIILKYTFRSIKECNKLSKHIVEQTLDSFKFSLFIKI